MPASKKGTTATAAPKKSKDFDAQAAAEKNVSKFRESVNKAAEAGQVLSGIYASMVGKLIPLARKHGFDSAMLMFRNTVNIILPPKEKDANDEWVPNDANAEKGRRIVEGVRNSFKRRMESKDGAALAKDVGYKPKSGGNAGQREQREAKRSPVKVLTRASSSVNAVRYAFGLKNGPEWTDELSEKLTILEKNITFLRQVAERYEASKAEAEDAS